MTIKAAGTCPTQSIGAISRPPRPAGLFPQELADGVLRELTRLGVTKPMRFTPGANAED